jgi:sulfopropanediol 3-dehydrogenase
VAALSWRDNGIVMVADNAQEAVRLSDDYAPEHLELHVREPGLFTENLTCYGSLFVGEETTVAYGTRRSAPTTSCRPAGRPATREACGWVSS